MPLPSPKGNQKKSSFVSSCMSSEKMKKEFPDHKQRLAVCHSRLKKAKACNCKDWEKWDNGPFYII